MGSKHPALACFNDPQQGDLRRVEFQKLLPLKSVEPNARVLLQAGDWLVAAEIPVGKGRCLYFGTTADRDWTELPRTPMYVPLTRQLLAYLTDQLTERSLVTSGLVTQAHPKAGITPLEGDEARWFVTNIDARELALERVTADELHRLVGGSTGKHGDADAASGLTLPPTHCVPRKSGRKWHGCCWPFWPQKQFWQDEFMPESAAAETSLIGWGR